MCVFSPTAAAVVVSALTWTVGTAVAWTLYTDAIVLFLIGVPFGCKPCVTTTEKMYCPGWRTLAIICGERKRERERERE